MAVEYESGESKTFSGFSATMSHTISGSSNRKLIAMVHWEDPNNATLSASYNSVAMTLVSSVHNSARDMGINMWMMDESDLPSSGSYDVEISYGTFINNGFLITYELSSTDPSYYYFDESLQTSVTSITNTVNSVDGGAIIGGFICNSNETISATSGQTVRANSNLSTYDYASGYETIATTGGTEVLSWSSGTTTDAIQMVVYISELADIGETLSGGTSTLSGGDINIALDSDLAGGTVSASGGDITVGLDVLTSGGSCTITGGDIDVNFSINADLEGGVCSHIGGAVEFNYGGTINEDLDGGTISLSGGEISVVLDGIFNEDLLGGTYTLRGADLIPWASWRPEDNTGRHYALPGERMRGCVLAEDFYSHIRTNMAGGNALGGPVYSDSAYVDGLAHFIWNEVPLEDTFSAVVQFSAASVSNGLLFGTEDVPSATVDGWQITVDATGIRANHSDGTATQTQCSIDVDYADGEYHTVSYVVDMISGDHTLYVDSDSDTQSTTATGTIGSGALLRVNDGGFAGTINYVRLFDSVLSEGEHQVYVAGTLPTIVDNALATYRCDSLLDRPDHIWSKLLSMRDLTKGDGAGNDYPTLTDSHYVFGGSDYVSDWPDRPTEWTDSAAFETSGYPYITQVNDDVIKTSLTVPGFFTGKMHNLILHEGELTEIEEKELEYRQLANTERGYAKNIDCQLINEEACFLSYYYSVVGDIYNDYSRTLASNSNNNVLFDDPGIRVFGWNIQSFTSFDIKSMTIEMLGTNFQSTGSTETLGYVPGFFSLDSSPYDANNITITIGGSSAQIPSASLGHIAVTLQDGSRPRFFANGEFIAEGNNAVSFNGSINQFYIGGKEFGSDHAFCTFYKYSVHKAAMTNAEIKNLYNNARRFFEETT